MSSCYSVVAGRTFHSVSPWLGTTWRLIKDRLLRPPPIPSSRAGTAELTADASSLRVQSGSGGMKPLDEDDKANIHQTIDDEVLRRRDIAFRSTAVSGGRVEGELTLAGSTRPLTLALAVADDGAVSGSATITQSDWGMKPYSALFGTLKVLDDVEISLQGHL